MEETQKLVVKLNDGTEVEANIVTFLKDNELNKEYVLYTLGEDEDEVSVYASIFVEEETGYKLLPIQDEKEWEMVQAEIGKLAQDE